MPRNLFLGGVVGTSSFLRAKQIQRKKEKMVKEKTKALVAVYLLSIFLATAAACTFSPVHLLFHILWLICGIFVSVTVFIALKSKYLSLSKIGLVIMFAGIATCVTWLICEELWLDMCPYGRCPPGLYGSLGNLMDKVSVIMRTPNIPGGVIGMMIWYIFQPRAWEGVAESVIVSFVVLQWYLIGLGVTLITEIKRKVAEK